MTRASLACPSPSRPSSSKLEAEPQGVEGGAGSRLLWVCELQSAGGVSFSGSLVRLPLWWELSECLFSESQYPFVLIGLSSFAA